MILTRHSSILGTSYNVEVYGLGASAVTKSVSRPRSRAWRHFTPPYLLSGRVELQLRCCGTLPTRQNFQSVRLRNLLACASSTSDMGVLESPSKEVNVLVKICGVTTAEDAALAAQAGADLIGMIIWPKAKRSVLLSRASEIVAVTKKYGVRSVGVFVEEDADAITAACSETGLDIVQLHGDGARSALPSLPLSLQVIYVLQADDQGNVLTSLPMPRGASGELVDWILLDGITGGSGTKLNWAGLRVPQGISRNGWLLAGGLTPDNVAEAVRTLSPTGVDVSSGVTMADGIAKDPGRVTAFLREATSLSSP